MSLLKRFLLSLVICPAAGWAGPELVRDAPHVWNVKTTEATIAWFTNEDGRKCQLQFGPTPDYGTTLDPESRAWPLLTEGTAFHHHVAVVRELKPDTRYYYRVVSGNVGLTPDANSNKEDYSFVTAKLTDDNKPFTFLVVGDGGEGNKYQRAITYQMEQAKFDFVLHTGDVVYDQGADAEWHLNYYPIYKNLIRNHPWYLSLGNHEYLRAPEYYVVAPEFALGRERLFRKEAFDGLEKKDPRPLKFKSQATGAASGYFENVVLPDQPGGERYYSFDWGPVHVAVLDSNRSYTPGKPGEKQYQWLEEDMSKSTAKWKIVAFHHPMVSIGKPEYAFSASSATNLRKDWHPLFEKVGIDVVFVGHDHTYQRTHPIRVNAETGDITRDDDTGIVHIVTGGGGAGLSAQSIQPPPEWHTGVFHKRHHFLLVNVDGDTLDVKVIADADINTPGVTEKQGLGGPSETLETFKLRKLKRAVPSAAR